LEVGTQIGDSGHEGCVSVRMCGDKIKEKTREQYFVAKRGEKKFKGGS